MSERPTVYLVDGTAYVYRAFFAIRQQLSTSAGLPTKAVFGFKNMLQKLVQKEKPHYLGVAFDERGPTFRHEMDPNYKANRPPMPDDLEVQIPYIHRLIEAFNIPTIRLQGYEADDILGTLARRFEAAGCDVVLVTSDKDLCQLVTEHTTILDTMKEQRFGVAEVKERFGVEPPYVVDFLGLMGDASDNIPGVPGVGEKTARQLLEQFGNLDDLLEQVDSVKRPKLRESLRDNADLARQSRVLATINVETPVDVDLPALALADPDNDALTVLYTELEFHGDLQAIRSAKPAAKPVDKAYRMITDLADLEAEIAVLRQAEGFAIDTETTSQDPMRADLVGISLAYQPHAGVYIPLRHSYIGAPAQLDAALVLERLRPLLEDPDGAEIRPEHQVRRHRSATAGHHPAGRRLRHHGGRLPAQPLAARSQHGRPGARVPAIRTHQLRRRGGQGRQAGDLRPGGHRARHRIQRRGRRRHPAAGAGTATAPGDGAPGQAVCRRGNAAHRRAGDPRAAGHGAGQPLSASDVHPLAGPHGNAAARHLHAGRRGVQRQFAAAVAAHPVRATEAAARQEDQDRLFDRHVGAGKSGGRARVAGAHSGLPAPRQDEVHLRRRPAPTPAP